jgi:hypothetical protein
LVVDGEVGDVALEVVEQEFELAMFRMQTLQQVVHAADSIRAGVARVTGCKRS